jgi:type IV pilus assembly protein PilV
MAVTGARREDGFTLLEVVIALGVLAFGLLALAAMQLHSLRQGTTGRHSSVAMTIAQDKMEEFLTLPFADADLTPGASWKTPETVTRSLDGGAASEEQSYSVDWLVTNEVTDWMKRVDVRVTWDEPDWPGRQLVLSSRRFNW